ncbi:MAG: GspH/FimT family protein [Planctomycetota bacterium]|jgi:prepilin-type N-terminal cleavage/methylation domain-containing protein
MRTQNLKTQKCGFTITEMLLVVVLIVLVAGVGGSFTVGTYKKMLTEKAAREFLLAAKYARITAIERQSTCRIELDAKNNSFALTIDRLDDQAGETEKLIVQDLFFKPTELPADVEFEDVKIDSAGSEEPLEQAESHSIAFSPDGTAQSAVIQIGDGKNHITISISAATGKVKVYKGTAKEVKVGIIDLDEQWQ